MLDAALRVFADEGYHRSSVDRITKVAGCSRVSFYQYFASKEDVYRQLAGQVARQLSASIEALAPLGPGDDGWHALRTWVARHSEIHARYEPVFYAYETDDALAAVAARTGSDVVQRLQSRLVTTTMTPRLLHPVSRLLLETINHTLGIAGMLRSAAADAYPVDRVETVLADILHRSLFGARVDVNMHPPMGPIPPTLRFSDAMREMLQDDTPLSATAESNRALEALLATGRDVFVTRGYHNTRVDDLVEAAAVSHGAFYRYFGNKADLARVLTARGLRSVGDTLSELSPLLPDSGSPSKINLRRWLRRYHTVQTSEAAMSRVWLDAALQDPALHAEVAPPWDWGRRRLARYLAPRNFGDVDLDAVVMVALLGVFAARGRPAADVEAAAQIIERGLLGR